MLNMLYEVKPKKFKPKFIVVSCFIGWKSKVLLLHRQNDKPEGDTWGMPAGKVEMNEDIYKGVIREIFEETGIKTDENSIKYFKELFVKYPDYDFIYHIFSIDFDKEPNIRINKKEHKESRWVEPGEALGMNLIQDLDKCISLFYF